MKVKEFFAALEAAGVALRNVPLNHDVAKAIKAIDDLLEMVKALRPTPLEEQERGVKQVLEAARKAAVELSKSGCVAYVNVRCTVGSDDVPRVYSVLASDWHVDGSTVETYVNGARV